MTLDELTAPAVECRRGGCGHSYVDHDPAGGHCRAHVVGWGAVERDVPCPCPGFRWVEPSDPGRPPTYSGRPEPSAP